VHRLYFCVVCFYTRLWAAVNAICSLARPSCSVNMHHFSMYFEQINDDDEYIRSRSQNGRSNKCLRRGH